MKCSPFGLGNSVRVTIRPWRSAPLRQSKCSAGLMIFDYNKLLGIASRWAQRGCRSHFWLPEMLFGTDI